MTRGQLNPNQVISDCLKLFDLFAPDIRQLGFVLSPSVIEVYNNVTNMLPSFTNLKKRMYDQDIKPMFERMCYRDPLLANIKRTVYHEGSESNYQTVDGDIVHPETQMMSAEFQISIEEVEKQDVNIVLRKLEVAAEQLSSQQARSMFRTISQITEKTGHSLDAGGKKFTPEHFLEMVEKIQIDFDEDTGQPSLPSIYIHPSLADQVREMIQKAEADPSHKAKFDEILEKKRREWNDREANRKLVE